MIAGETSLAYDEIFTLTLITGRTVGIGAYLVRLGQVRMFLLYITHNIEANYSNKSTHHPHWCIRFE
jgi:hypothetical protein